MAKDKKKPSIASQGVVLRRGKKNFKRVILK